MAVLIAAVILLGGLVLLNLLLTGAVIRKLRKPASESRPDWGHPQNPGLPAGAEVPAFSALTVANTKVTADDFAGERTLIGFFSTDCRHCLPKAPVFVATARDAEADGVRALAVVVAGQEDPTDLINALTDDVSVVVEGESGSMVGAFAITAFPWFFLVGPDATVAATGHEPDRLLPAPSHA
ncbi:redoxin domain-containing protein [Microbispora sp. NBC_01189]|uniref:redoxin domain-containing protein n=1 Tax=Microbispora sp. NBC_01189 TaxID=2903583 RepID=UPI002E0F8D60|nr:redoxin domain-containing protein [Microbispora sp. NBC_01189]